MSTNCATKPCELSSVSLQSYITIQTNDTSKCWTPTLPPCNNSGSPPAPSPTEDKSGSGGGIGGSVTSNLLAKIKALKCKFHRDRKLLVKHLPRNVVKQEIAQLLNNFAIESIHLSSNDDKSSTATVTLENPEVLDDWNSDRTFLLRGQSVSVSPTPTEAVLCVAKLPFHYDESDFYELVKGFGEVKMCFPMISEKTGASKGYGFVQYVSKESALSARNTLNDRMIDTFQLVCDWLDSSHLTFKSLHSTCLYVDHLPRQFRDMGEFRAIFEKIVKPPYCQIALRNGCPQDWGLVEYLSAGDAELAQTSCNNALLRGQPIRVVYSIPGIRAITLMLNLLDTQPRGKSMGLLPDPSGQSIRMSIENLSKQNPIFAENLKNIILHQIQESKHQVKDGREEAATVKPNITPAAGAIAGGKLMADPPKNATVDVTTLKHHNLKEMEKIIPPTPPMTPTIINTLPIMSPAGSGPPTVVPILPNTSVPPPTAPSCVDKMTYAHSPLSIGAGKERGYAAAMLWNDLLAGQAHFAANGFMPATIQPAGAAAATRDSAVAAAATAAFGIPTTTLTMGGATAAANFAQEIVNLPLNMQQNLLNLINGSSAISLPMPGVAAAAGPHSTAVPLAQTAAPPTAHPFSFSPLAPAVDPATANWLLQQQKPPPMTALDGAATLVTTPLGPSLVAMPVGPTSKATMLPNWPAVSSFMATPTSIPIFTTSGADWQNVRLHPHMVATSTSTPVTPISHHLQSYYQHHYAAGQKRKLLPSPEKSPEGNYIGQHSQGIGGHYADSYFKKKKMF